MGSTSTSPISNNITDNVQAYADEVNKRKAADEANYEAAKGQTELAVKAKAGKKLRLSQISCWSKDKKSYEYRQASNEVALADNSLFTAESNESNARDRFMDSNAFAGKINIAAILA